MSLFDALSIANTGTDAMQTWIDAAGANVANANDTVRAGQPTYAEQTAVFTPIGAAIPGATDQGVSTTVVEGSNAGTLAYEPNSPLANNKGEVTVANIPLSDQLVGLIQAQEGYGANTDVMSRAVAAYTAGLTIGS